MTSLPFTVELLTSTVLSAVAFALASAPAPPVKAEATIRLAPAVRFEFDFAVIETLPDLFSMTALSISTFALVTDSRRDRPAVIWKPETLSILTPSWPVTSVTAPMRSSPFAALVPFAVRRAPLPTLTIDSNGLSVVPMSVPLASTVTAPRLAEPDRRLSA